MKPKQEDISNDTVTASIVYDYMCKVTPKMAEEFKISIKSEELDMSCNITLEEVVRECSRRKKAVQECVDCKSIEEKAGLCKEENDSKSGFNLIDMLLAKSVAKVNAMVTEQRIDENKKFEHVDKSNEAMTASIAYHYMRKVTPKLATSFLTIMKPDEVFMNCTITVEEVVRGYYSSKEAVQDCVRIKHCSKGEKYKAKDDGATKSNGGIELKTKIGKKRLTDVHRNKMPAKVTRFTAAEHAKIRSHMKEFGDDVNIAQLAKELDRNYVSVLNCVKKLKLGHKLKKHKAFSLTDDLKIMDEVLENLAGKKLKDLDFPKKESWLIKDLDRGKPSLIHRWCHFLQPTILQHYAGTLNLDIRRMLATHLSENYDSVEDVDWAEVAEIPDFAGHTELSLRVVWTHIKANVKSRGGESFSLKQICDGFNSIADSIHHRGPNKINNADRQNEVIQYF